MNLEQAIAIAVDAHAGQIDKAGKPYLLHPLRIMLKLETTMSALPACSTMSSKTLSSRSKT
jgi:GTP diphosphokinase / guanosine-3',5'-bis(diphosphate) 3'-diphosphatase